MECINEMNNGVLNDSEEWSGSHDSEKGIELIDSII